MLTALATEALGRFREAMVKAGEAGDSALERYRAMGRSYVRFALESPGYFHILGRPEFYSARDETFSRSYQELFEALSEAAAAAQREGEVEGLDPQAFLISTWAMAHGLATLWLDGTLEGRIGPVDIEAIAAAAFDVVFASSESAARVTSVPS